MYVYLFKIPWACSTKRHFVVEVPRGVKVPLGFRGLGKLGVRVQRWFRDLGNLGDLGVTEVVSGFRGFRGFRGYRGGLGI